jgi:hypothetical protein
MNGTYFAPVLTPCHWRSSSGSPIWDLQPFMGNWTVQSIVPFVSSAVWTMTVGSWSCLAPVSGWTLASSTGSGTPPAVQVG